jgi:hypothetical protein
MEIQPDKQNLNQTFSTTVFSIDFYQRDYKWTEEPVRRLLDDVFYQFDEAYQKHGALEPNQENINARYPWYYLNTYVTNTVAGRVFVVDGQQRLTTLTLVLLKLHSMALAMKSRTVRWLDGKIAGHSGTDHDFWMNHVHHKHVLEALLENRDPAEIDRSSGVTAVNMLNNYKVISDVLDDRLNTVHRFETFVHYFLYRLVLINLSVDSTHVPMVFEVINDRGVRLKPYEILKGKLLGQIDKMELESGHYNELWERQVQTINDYYDDEIDNFFRYWLKAKFALSRKDGQRFDGDYHREIFKTELNESLRLDHNPAEVKAFLRGPFRYYSDLYSRMLEAEQAPAPGYRAVYYNGLNEQDSQFLLVLSACTVDDPEEDAKIRAVSEGLDRMFSLLQLQGAYESNEFGARIYDVSNDLRDRAASEIPLIFEKHLVEELRERRATTVEQSFSYALFRPMSIDRLNTRFTRYFFGRIEQALAEGMKQNMRHSLKDLVTLRGVRNGFHVEHILCYNDENYALFADDEERFEVERNRLGAVVLLKGRDNISSSNERFRKKLKSYANTLLWNETLRADTYKSKLDFNSFAASTGLKFEPLERFGPEEVEARQKLLFDLSSFIWPAPSQAA